MASKNSSSHFKRANHSEKVLNILKVYFHRKEMCDIVIIAGIDGVKVSAHRILLSACSLYFLNVFTNALHQHEGNEVTVASVSGSSLNALIDYCYSGVLEIRKDNAKPLLAASYLLQMDDVYKGCQDYFVDNLDACNSLEVAQMAENYSFTDVQRKAEAFTRKHFMAVCKTQEFMGLNFEQLGNLIASDELVVDSEEDVFHSCVSWVSDDRADREKYFYQLLAFVRFPLMSPHFITEHLRSHSLCKSSECKDLIFEAMAWHLNPKTHSALNTQPRISPTAMDWSSSDEIVLAIGSNEKREIVLQSYNNTDNEWTAWNITLTDQWLFICAVLGDSLFLMSEYNGTADTAAINSYDFKSKTLTAQKPLNTPRSSMGCAVLDGYVYVIGGFDGLDRLNSVERWDPKVKTWTYMDSMAIRRYGMGVAVLGKYLYAVGGMASSYENSVERYDPNTNKWKFVASMNTARHEPGVTAGNGYLYCIGGTVGASNITTTVERFDPVANKWTMICSIGSGRRETSCAFLGNRLMAVCGHNGYCWQSTVDEYDLETDQWTVKKPFSGLLDFIRVVKISGKYFHN